MQKRRKKNANKNETKFYYDGTFERFLWVIFTTFEKKVVPVKIQQNCNAAPGMFSQVHKTETIDLQAKRVWTALENRTSPKNARMVHVAFLSELPGIEMLLCRYLSKIFTKKEKDFYRNMLDEDVMNTIAAARKVYKEAHLFLGLVRFQETADGLFFAPIDPTYNILKLIGHHFKDRYRGQKWVIYDTKRKYGLFYNADSIKEINIHDPQFDLQSGKLVEESKNIDEDQYQELWKSYYDAINIPQRQNTRQMRRMMPERYWKYLPEKQKKKGRGGGHE